MFNPPIELILILIFAAVLIIGQGVAGTVLARADRLGRANKRMRMLDAGMTRDEVATTLLRPSIAKDQAKTLWRSLTRRLSDIIAQAGLSVSVEQVLLYTVGGALVLWLISLAAIMASHKDIIVNGATALVGALAVAFIAMLGWVRSRQEKRIRRIDEQLPLALDIMARALRAGHPVISTVQLAAREMKDPIGTEFGLIVDEVNFGADFKTALDNFAARTGSDDARYLTVAISVQLETGGNLAEILANIAGTMRARATLKKRVKALASEGRMSAYILSALPAGLIGFELLFNPRFYTDKFSDPIFWPAVTVIGLMYLTGWLIMNRIMNFKY